LSHASAAVPCKQGPHLIRQESAIGQTGNESDGYIHRSQQPGLRSSQPEGISTRISFALTEALATSLLGTPVFGLGIFLLSSRGSDAIERGQL
jgi:hypothetical protein